MIVDVNKEGFTLWSDAGFILTDCPFERLKEDPKLMFDLLNIIHKKELERKNQIKFQQSLTSICLKCGIDLSKCICK